VTVITTSPTGTATAYSNQRKVDRCQNGVLWTTWHDGGNLRAAYSTDDGATWPSVATQFAIDASDAGANWSFFIDLDDYAHVAYKDGSDGYVYYRRGTPNAARTAWTWSAAVQFAGTATAYNYPDIVTHRQGTGWVAHIALSSVTSSTTNYAFSFPLTIASDGAVTVGARVTLGGSYGNGHHTRPSIGFNHTGDGKTVAGSAPHLYAAWSAGATGAGKGIRFKKATYSAGAWTWGTEREIDNGRIVTSVRQWITCLFDGTAAIISGLWFNGGTLNKCIYERNAADTAQSALFIGPNIGDGQLAQGSTSYDGDRNVYMIGGYTTADTATDELRLLLYDRASQTVDESTVLATVAGDYQKSVSAKRGYSDNRIEFIYTDGTASPYSVTYDSISLNTTPNAPTSLSPAGKTIDKDAAQRFSWAFSDPDTGDSQSAYDLRYRVVGTATWTTVSGGSPQYHDFAAGTFLAGDYEWQVRTTDNGGLVGPWSSSAFFTAASTPAGPSISDPINGGTIGSDPYTVHWTVSAQDAYQVRTVADSAGAPDTTTVYTDTGIVESSSARSRSVPFPVNGRAEHVQVRVRSAGLWSSWASVSVTVSYTKPAAPTVTETADSTVGTIAVTANHPAPSGSEPTVVTVDWYRRETFADGTPVNGPDDPGLRIAAGQPPTDTFTDWRVASGQHYAYRARAWGDNGVSAWSPWTGPADVTAPTAPTGVTATATGETTVDVAWAASTDDRSAQSALLYRVYRDGTLAGTTVAGATSFNDSGLTGGTTYSYTVSAVDESGNESAQSTAASATTDAAALTTAVMDIHGGGNVTGSFWHAGTDTVFARTDVGGAYRRDGARWTELLDAAGLAALDYRDYEVAGIGVAPSDVNTIYLLVGGTSSGRLLTTRDGGTTWTALALPGNGPGGNDGSEKRYYQRIAVDPLDPTHAIIAKRDGFWRTIDAGVSVTKLDSPGPSTGSRGGTGLLFDAGTGAPTLNARSQRFYASWNGDGTADGFYRHLLSDDPPVWTIHSGTWGVLSNQATGNQQSGAATVDVGGHADHFAQATLVNVPNVGLWWGIMARATDRNNCYMVEVGDDGTATLFLRSGGTNTSLGATAAGTAVAGDVYRIEVSGSTITGYRNGVSFASATDTTFATQTRAGMRLGEFNSTTDNVRWDNFSAGTLDGTTYTFSDNFDRADNTSSLEVNDNWTKIGLPDVNGDFCYEIRQMSNDDLLASFGNYLYRIAGAGTTTPTVTAVAAVDSLHAKHVATGIDNVRLFTVNPANEDIIVIGDHTGGQKQSSNVAVSYDAGATWNALTTTMTNGGDGAVWPMNTDLANTNTFLTANDFIWTKSGDLWFFEGMGVWKGDATSLNATNNPTGITLGHASAGIEEIVANHILKVPAGTVLGDPGRLLMGGWDRNLWRWEPNEPPVTELPQFGSAWSIATCRADRSVVVAVLDNHQNISKTDYATTYDADRQSRVSTDGGKTWTRMGSLVNGVHPADLKGGNIAVSSTDSNRLVWLPTESSSAPIYYSTDRGGTWTAATGLPASHSLHRFHTRRRHVLTADPNDGLTFYVMNEGSGGADEGVLRSIDGGQTWAGMSTTGLANNKDFNADLIAVDNGAGATVLFFTFGYSGGWEYDLMKSTDAGATWTAITACPGAYRVAEGAPVGGVPTIWCDRRDPTAAAQVYDRQIVRSTDMGATWEVVASFPLGRYDLASTLAGDPENPDIAYVGYMGTGVIRVVRATV
jgi:hypothetical protein